VGELDLKRMPMSSQDENRSPDAVKLDVKQMNNPLSPPAVNHFNLGINSCSLLADSLFNDPEP